MQIQFVLFIIFIDFHLFVKINLLINYMVVFASGCTVDFSVTTDEQTFTWEFSQQSGASAVMFA